MLKDVNELSFDEMKLLVKEVNDAINSNEVNASIATAQGTVLLSVEPDEEARSITLCLCGNLSGELDLGEVVLHVDWYRTVKGGLELLSYVGVPFHYDTKTKCWTAKASHQNADDYDFSLNLHLLPPM